MQGRARTCDPLIKSQLLYCVGASLKFVCIESPDNPAVGSSFVGSLSTFALTRPTSELRQLNVVGGFGAV